ncbi:MAG: hypothetical protein F6K39_05200 [Okeania sp. SIO3B3]|nr:hypothetical protein [Okeania sp. SIO3B3]
MELVSGEIIVMSPSGLESDEVAAIVAYLWHWIRHGKLGRVIASSGDIRTPDASFRFISQDLPMLHLENPICRGK